MTPIAKRLIIGTSIVVGLIAWDAWQHRRRIVRFARFMVAYDAPTVPEPVSFDPSKGDL